MEERWLDVDGIRVFTHAWGAGRPVLYWHGIGLRSQAGLTLACAPELAEHGLRIAALDVPGWGKSPPLERERYHPRALADLAADVLDALDWERAAFIGFSWGADIGLHLAAAHPDRLTALVLLDAGYADPPLDPSWPFERFLAEVEAAWEPGNTPAEVIAAAQLGMAQDPPTRELSGLPVLLVVAGGADEGELARFATQVPHAEIVRAPEAGHDVLRDGGPELVRRVGTWLAGHT